jgi:hypothetical protein
MKDAPSSKPTQPSHPQNANQWAVHSFSSAPPNACIPIFRHPNPHLLSVAFTISRCLLNQLFGMSCRRWSTRWLLCSRLERSYQAVAIMEFSRVRFFIKASFAAFTPVISSALSHWRLHSLLKESGHEDIRCTGSCILTENISLINVLIIWWW